MKKTLLKFSFCALFCAVSFIGNAAETAVLNKEWSYTNAGMGGTYEVALPAQADARMGATYGDKMYIFNRAEKNLYVYDGKSATVETIALTGPAGSGINFDYAGNMVVKAGFAATTTDNKYYIIPKGTTTPQLLDLSAVLPSGQRNDNIGKIYGDIMSAEGGVMCVCQNTEAIVHLIYIINGQCDGMDNITLTTANNAESVATYYGPERLIVMNRGTTYRKINTTADPVTDNAINISKIGTNGGDIFTIYGTDYFVYPVGPTTYLDGFAVQNLTTGEVIATHTETSGFTRATYSCANWLWAVKENATKVSIFQYNPGNIVAKYTLDVTPTAVEATEAAAESIIGRTGEIAINANSAKCVEIYNIDGTLAKSVNAQQGETTISMPAGIYFTKGQKIVVK